MFSDSGLDNAQISALFFIWSACGMAFEVPAGLIADRYDRRKVIFAGCLFAAVGYAFWALVPNFWGFAIGFVLWGVQGSLVSGTFEALVYDELASTDESDRYTKVIGHAQGFGLVGVLAASLAAVLVPDGSYVLAIVLSILAILAAMVVALLLPRAAPREEMLDTEYFSELKSGLLLALRSKPLRVAMFLATITAAAGALEEYEPLFIQEVGVSQSGVALVVTITGALTAAGAFVAHRFGGSSRAAIVIGVAVSGGLLVGAAALDSRLGLVPLALFFFVGKIVEVVAGARVQHEITSTMRATITSVNNFVIEVFNLAVFVIFAVVATSSTLAGFSFVGLGLVAIAVSFFLVTLLGGLKRADGNQGNPV